MIELNGNLLPFKKLKGSDLIIVNSLLIFLVLDEYCIMKFGEKSELSNSSGGGRDSIFWTDVQE